MAHHNLNARTWLLATTATVILTGAARADEAGDAPTTVEQVIVTGDIAFRNRTSDPNPVLSYDLEYFQRFEPISVGEMLKRVPGVTFTSDVLEFDGVSMRGLPPGYTQILINGRRAPGGESDRSFFVDRIPAELVERIEIIRSPRADQPSEGVAGSLNVILKEGAQLQGGFVKAGALINEDGKVRPSGAIAYAGSSGDTSYWAALNYQGRRNPKKKTSWRYDGTFSELDNIERQDDTRDGVDISANGEVTHRFDGGRIRVNGLIVDTDRDEDETSLTYVDAGGGRFTELDEAEVQAERISQQTYQLSADGKFDLAGGTLELNVGWNGYREDTTSRVTAGGDLDDLELDEVVGLDITDDEYTGSAAYTWGFSNGKLKAGVDVLRKVRDGAEVEFEVDDGAVGDPDPAPGAIYKIEETRIDPFVRYTYTPNDQWTIDAGLRVENTDRDVTSDAGNVSYSKASWNPSLHLTYAPNSTDQFRASIARTVRRADYDLLKPYLAEEEPTDEDDLRGNPELANESSWGLDVGYEHRIGAQGIVGVNFFYRDVSDLIELVGTNEVSSSGDGRIYEPRNIGSGETWGFEVDFSAPLTRFGLPDTGLFANYTYMDSKVKDPFTGEDRRFTNQPHHVYNVGFIHTVRQYGVSFGASAYSRSAGYESAMDETIKVAYTADMEAFIEKRIGDNVVVRLAGMNLLDKKKKETFRKYDGDSVEEILENRANGDIDEGELESERSGALYQVTLRVAF
ncbi:TonB-dependent receptor [Caulobacter segnis]|uniref:TonB-dependent receptor plug domain-containing protein n=1 Tax=Caulobacter segnis TaxID=88688 RepID=UPI00240FAB37|nr:TonB-dependent receptor [Caulobacter segnis]MDG2523133.1 TonB-dependent receptor [Caulobacter segnis]